MGYVFAPGCALTIENPEAAERLHDVLNRRFGKMARLDICCRNHPPLADGTVVINVCAGCDRRFRENYGQSTTISFWEIVDREDFWTFPDYGGRRMSVQDPCPVRTEARVHDAVRSLLKKMNIRVAEAEKNQGKSVCCGDSGWGRVPVGKVKSAMRKRAGQMPEDEVVVTCVSCIKSMHIGGKTPRHLVDLLIGAPTRIGRFEPDEWHQALESHIRCH